MGDASGYGWMGGPSGPFVDIDEPQDFRTFNTTPNSNLHISLPLDEGHCKWNPPYLNILILRMNS